MSRLQLKEPETEEEKQKHKEIVENAEEVVITKNSGKWFTDSVKSWNRNWIKFVPQATGEEIVTEEAVVKIPPHEVQLVDPPVGDSELWKGAAFLAGAATFAVGVRALRRQIIENQVSEARQRDA